MGFLSSLPLLGDACKTALDVFDNFKSNPKLRVNALRKLQDDSQSAHQKALKDAEENRRQYEESAKRSEQAANERIRSQIDENNKSIEKLRAQFKEQDDKYDEEMKSMNIAHDLKMKELRSESKEAREKAEMEHKMKVEKVEQEHKKEKHLAQEKLEQTKKEGALKIETVEKEKEKIIENRLIELDKYTEEMKEIARVHREQLQQIQERNRTLKIENAKQRREQLEIENSKIVQKLDGDIQKLLDHISHQNARDVVKKFQHIVEPVYNVQSSLENIRTYCILPNEEIPQVPMGELDPDFNLIHEQTKLFEYRVRCFQQFIINTTNTDPALFKVCSEFIKRMDTLMSKTELRSVCTHLPRALDDRNNKNIKLYGNYLGGLCSNFDEMKTSLNDGVQDITQKHVHGPSSNQRSIKE